MWPVHSYRNCVHTAPLRCSIGYSITLREEQCGVQYHKKSISSTAASHTRVEQTLIRQSTAELGAHKTPRRPSLISHLTHMPPFHSSPSLTENQFDEPNQHTPVPSQSHSQSHPPAEAFSLAHPLMIPAYSSQLSHRSQPGRATFQCGVCGFQQDEKGTFAKPPPSSSQPSASASGKSLALLASGLRDTAGVPTPDSNTPSASCWIGTPAYVSRGGGGVCVAYCTSRRAVIPGKTSTSTGVLALL